MKIYKVIDNTPKISRVTCAVLLVASLSPLVVACTNDKPEVKSIVSEQPENKNIIETSVDKALDADTAVEGAISVMLYNAEKLEEASQSATENQNFQKSKEEVKDNFNTLVEFLSGNKEIEGYTINDISDKTLEKSKSALLSLDNTIENYIPDYKDKAKGKLKQFGNWAWDKSVDASAYLKDKGTQWLDEVNKKSK